MFFIFMIIIADPNSNASSLSSNNPVNMVKNSVRTKKQMPKVMRKSQSGCYEIQDETEEIIKEGGNESENYLSPRPR